MGIKYRINEAFFDKWGHIMAYVLGYFYADGSLEDASYLRGKYIRVTSVEKYSILRIKRWLNSQHTVVKLKSTWPNGKPRYLLRIGDHHLYHALTRWGLYPNKSLTIKFPDIPKKYLGDFLRGYLDGDGCVYLYLSRGKHKRVIVKKLSVIFTSGSRGFLKRLSKILRPHIEMKKEKVYKGQRAFQLRLGTKDSINLFKLLYGGAVPGDFFRRKFNVFAQYFKLRPSRRDQTVQNILIRNGHMVK